MSPALTHVLPHTVRKRCLSTYHEETLQYYVERARFLRSHRSRRAMRLRHAVALWVIFNYPPFRYSTKTTPTLRKVTTNTLARILRYLFEYLRISFVDEYRGEKTQGGHVIRALERRNYITVLRTEKNRSRTKVWYITEGLLG